MKQFVFILFTALLSLPSLQAQEAAMQPNRQHRVVFHLTSPDTLVYQSLFKQLRHLREGWPQVEIEVVCHGPGISLLKQDVSTFGKPLQEWLGKGVVFAACENTLREKKIPKELIFSGVRFVPMGLGEIIEKQEAGWSYIKAGF